MDMNLIEQDGIEIINGRKIVKKHVAVVHSSNNLSLLERKIANVLLYVAFPNLKTEQYHYITISELKKLLDFNSKNTKALKDAIQNLQRTIIELNLLNDKLSGEGLEEGLFSVQILGLFQVVEKGVIKYSYPPELIGLLANPSIYAKINLPVQAKFRSTYSLALYENCVRFRGLPYTKNFDLKTFKKLMGVEEGKYEIFRDFNRRVLAPAVKEINTCSDIHITPDITRQGRRVRSIKFLLGERAIKKRLGKLTSTKEEKVNSPLAHEFNLDEKSFNELVQRYGAGDIEAAAVYVRSTIAYKKDKIPNIAGYFITAIKEGYGLNRVSKTKLDTDAGISKTTEISLEENYQRYLAKSVMEAYKSINSLKQKAMEADFFNRNNKSCSASLLMYYEKIGVKNILVFEMGFATYLINHYPKYFTNLVNFEDYNGRY